MIDNYKNPCYSISYKKNKKEYFIRWNKKRKPPNLAKP